MDLIPLPPHSLRIGQVLDFSLRDAEGKLLIARGQVLSDSPLVQALIQRGAWVQAHETKDYQRALAHKVDTMMHQGATLGAIARAQTSYRPERGGAAVPQVSDQAAWADLQLRGHALLREPRAEDFLPRFQTLQQEMLARVQQQTDAALMLLIFESSQDFQHYSARHALLSLLLCELCARQLGWAEDLRLVLGQAALSMNISISALQDRLAGRDERPSEAHRAVLLGHGDRSAELLRTLGVHDSLWLQIVRLHHEAGPGPLAARSVPEQMARVLRRVDLYGARLSPRRSRKALSGAQAARAVYLDELQQPDEAGAALIKAVGLYPPGSLVRLANGEVGVVAKRGHSANEPLVAALLGKSGAPLSEPVPRDTRLASQAIAASLAPHELKLLVNMERLLKLY
ncbi:HD-GYP domain-containing protein [Paucibacter sp. XJ19-41]|uniref:HD-GYP domain-containing protein n=1 Tax=Paucibacter sp. XJ19-41 TaxID=2927824 RepID=UPI00234B243A|nr:phosphohydrolase [Paucibacter sp. XJ19-41]MDC6168130.1 phosphohydrolase [Paucibacter sp. XJ19-41]